MRDYYINFFDKTGKLEETAMFHVGEGESLLDALEEALYILQELTPENSRTWKQELCTKQFTTFSYHRYEFFDITYLWNEHGAFEVKEK